MAIFSGCLESVFMQVLVHFQRKIKLEWKINRSFDAQEKPIANEAFIIILNS